MSRSQIKEIFRRQNQPLTSERWSERKGRKFLVSAVEKKVVSLKKVRATEAEAGSEEGVAGWFWGAREIVKCKYPAYSCKVGKSLELRLWLKESLAKRWSQIHWRELVPVDSRKRQEVRAQEEPTLLLMPAKTLRKMPLSSAAVLIVSLFRADCKQQIFIALEITKQTSQRLDNQTGDKYTHWRAL